jgi:Leucine-rich repeat (LRR) protein
VFEDSISESYLKQHFPDQNIAELETVSLVIDTSYQSVLDLGDLLPKMTKLYLDNSKLLTVRDLGTGLRHLQVLSLNNCGLNELDGIAMLSNLKCLIVRDNFISDINALAMHESLEVCPPSYFVDCL